MFRRSEKDIIRIVGEAFGRGQWLGEFNLATTRNGKDLYHRRTHEGRSDKIQKALLEYLGLEFKTETNVIVKKPNRVGRPRKRRK